MRIFDWLKFCLCGKAGFSSPLQVGLGHFLDDFQDKQTLLDQDGEILRTFVWNLPQYKYNFFDLFAARVCITLVIAINGETVFFQYPN